MSSEWLSVNSNFDQNTQTQLKWCSAAAARLRAVDIDWSLRGDVPSIRQISRQKHLLAGLQEAHIEPPKPEMQGQDLQLLRTAWNENYSTNNRTHITSWSTLKIKLTVILITKAKKGLLKNFNM